MSDRVYDSEKGEVIPGAFFAFVSSQNVKEDGLYPMRVVTGRTAGDPMFGEQVRTSDEHVAGFTSKERMRVVCEWLNEQAKEGFDPHLTGFITRHTKGHQGSMYWQEQVVYVLSEVDVENAWNNEYGMGQDKDYSWDELTPEQRKEVVTASYDHMSNVGGNMMEALSDFVEDYEVTA